MKQCHLFASVGVVFFFIGLPGSASDAVSVLPTGKAIAESILLVSIPAGSFRMGSPLNDKETATERPVHTVILTAFSMAAKEITHAQFSQVMGFNPSVNKGNDGLPVERVSWIDAVRFCNRLSDAAGFSRCYDETTWKCDFTRDGYRLPTEAEWEYACRASTVTEFNLCDAETDLGRAGWYRGNCIKSQVGGLKEPNAWGLCDMHGNVWELCNDWYDEAYYVKSPKNSPIGPASGEKKVLRGGSWTHVAHGCRSADRWSMEPDQKYGNIGFRVVRRPGVI